jgi:hypothetical protein
MRIPSHLLAAGALLVAVSTSAGAGEQQPPIAPLPSRPMPQVFPGRTKQQLVQEALAALDRHQQLRPAQPPMVICGMTLLPADPKMDASIRVRPLTTGVNPIIGRVTPQMCGGAGASQPALPTARPRLPQIPR